MKPEGEVRENIIMEQQKYDLGVLLHMQPCSLATVSKMVGSLIKSSYLLMSCTRAFLFIVFTTFTPLSSNTTSKPCVRMLTNK